MFGLFKKKAKENDSGIQEKTAAGVVAKETLQQAVTAFSLTEDELHIELGRIAAGTPVTAQQLYWFIPTALFHIMFPEVETVDGSYTILYPDRSKKEFLFSEDSVYQAIFEYLQGVCTALDKGVIYGIMGRSSEFDVVNQALNDREKANLEPNLERMLLSGPVYVMNESE